MKAYKSAAISGGKMVQLASNPAPPVLHPPLVSLPTQTAIADVSATVGATLDCNGLSTVWSIEYGATTGYGSNQAGGTTSENGAKTIGLTGLTQNTLIHWRFKAVNADGTAYSVDQTLLTVNTEFITYITGLSTPLSSGQQTKINTFVSSLKSGLSLTNLSDAFDVMYLLGGETSESSLRNIAKNAHHASLINAPSFTAGSGFKSNLTSSYIKTGYLPNTHKSAMSLFNIAFGVDIIAGGVPLSSNCEMGCRTDASNGLTMSCYYNASGRYLGRCNSALCDPIDVALPVNGTYVFSKTQTGNPWQSYKDGVQKADGSAVQSTYVTNSELYILCWNNAGTPGNFSNNTCRFAFLGRGLSSSEQLVLRNAINAFFLTNNEQSNPSGFILNSDYTLMNNTSLNG